MKLKIEKVPQGVKISVGGDAVKKPAVFVLSESEVGVLAEMLRTAVRANSFVFEYDARD